jgi:translation initiation factor 3 subunit B
VPLPRRCRFDSFWNFAWRPRPPSLLPEEKEREITRNLKSYAKKYDEQDELLLAAADTELLARRARKRAEWEAFVQSKKEWLAQQEEHVEAVLGHVPQPPAYTLAETDVQQIIDVREDPYVA